MTGGAAGRTRVRMSRKPKPPPFSLEAPETPAPAGLPLQLDPGVRLVLEGPEPAAVEAAAAELKARFGSRFAVLDRRVLAGGAGLRVTAGLRVQAADLLDLQG